MSSTPPRLDSDNPSVLPMGTRLGEFEVRGVLGVGGFGIVYLAFDHALEREVAVKEYMPASLAGRTETMHVSLRSQSDADTFALGLRSFVNEAKLLARFDHPSLLKVHRYWEANGTAYMAMPVMRGRTLKEVRAEMGQPPDEAWLRGMLTPLLSAIDKLHAEGVYHRDIAPDNIQIGHDGVPVLLDFGAARRVISDKSQTLTAILKPAYAPIEQYAEAGSVKQGPWTDLYALGATLHYLLLNRPPPPATTRAIHDEASGLVADLCPGCSEDFLRTIDWMLAPRPADRPQNVAALREVLDGHQSPPLRRADAAAQVSQWDRTVIVSPGQSQRGATVPPSALDLSVADPDATRVVPLAPGPTTGRAAASDATVFEPSLHTAPPSASRVVPAPRAAAAPAPAPAAPPASVSPAVADVAAPSVAAAPAAPAAQPGGRRWLPVAVGAGLVAVAAVAFALWPRGAAEPLPEAAAPASAAAMAEPASSAAPPAVAEPASAAVAESAVATVVVPGAPAARPPAVAPEVPAANTRPAATAAKPPAATRPASNGPVVASVPAAPTPEPVRAPAPAPVAVQPVAPTASVAPPPEPAKPVVEAGPEALCQGRNALSYFVCMERECLRSKFQSHNDCQKWRKEASRREGN